MVTRVSETEVPEMMKAVALGGFGGPDVLEVETLSVPGCGDDEILIRVDAAGVGVWDPWEREGGMADMMGRPRFPYVPGSDGAGEVVALGRDVTRFAKGDRVYAYGFGNPKGGFYAEYAAVPAHHAARIPRGLSVEQAGVLAVDGITALRGLDHLALEPGQRLLIVGASGGIGHIALQLAKRMGARVLAAASGADGLALVRRLGADGAVDGHDREALAQACQDFGPDAALVLACDDVCQRALKHVPKGGRIAYPHGVEPAPVGPEGVDVIGYDGVPDPQILDRLNGLIESGPFDVAVSQIYPLEEAAKAQAQVQKHHVGKLALRVH
jgi:NADPH2:quinone reductase